MAKRKATRPGGGASSAGPSQRVNATADELLLAALEEGGDPAKTGRFLMTFKEGALEAGTRSLRTKSGLRMANARDFTDQAGDLAQAGDAEGVVFPGIGVALVSGEAAATRGFTTDAALEDDSAVQSVDPEYFMFATQVNPTDYMRGVLHTAQMIYADLGGEAGLPEPGGDAAVEVLGATWGLSACKVPPSAYTGVGIKVAVLDTGFDLRHPEFANRAFVTSSFVGQPVQDLHGHGTHTAGTALGPKGPSGPIQRYGIGYRSQI